MPESIESLRRPPLEVVDLPTDKLRPDPANPNRVPPELMAAIKIDIVERGFVQPVLVRPAKGKWIIEDGEHRWRILTELKIPETPCVIDDGDEDQGRMRMLTMNALRGRPAPVKLARVLVRAAEKLSPEELQRRLGMSEGEYRDAVALKDVADDLDQKLRRALEREAAKAPEVLRWRVGPRQADAIDGAVDTLVERKGCSRAEALIEILNTTGSET